MNSLKFNQLVIGLCLVILLAHPCQSEERFDLNENHIKLIRNMVIIWDITESGAPSVSPLFPYGSTDIYKDIQRLTEINSREDMKRIHEEMKIAFPIFLMYATLSPGDYQFQNKLKNKFIDTMEIKANTNQNKGIKKEMIRFKFTEQHAKLLQAAHVRWNEWEGWDEMKFNPVPGIDPKRPYGAMTYFEIDMAIILGIKYKTDNKNHPIFTPEQEKMFLKVHEEMLAALQVFLIHGKMEPGSFIDPEGYGNWERTSGKKAFTTNGKK